MKNVIILVTDTFRFDNLFSYATRPVHTPALDRFCETRATEVTGFYTASFPTIPNRTDLATGIAGWPHYPWQPIDVSSPNHIGQLLRRYGYVTQLICDCPHLFNCRFQFGFDAAYQHRGQEGDKPLLHLNDPITEEMPSNKTRRSPQWRNTTLANAHRWVNRYFNVEEDTFAAKTAATTVRWLEENYSAKPFFLWVDFFDPHEPWDPPEYMVRKYDPDYDGTPMIHCNYGPADDYTDAELYNLWAHYAAESELVDRYLGRILEKIDDLLLWDESVVIITSDHGTSIGEHNRTGKSNIADNDSRFWPIYPDVGHVPFLIAGGDVPKGQKRNFLAQPPDILPTLADLAGIELATPAPIDGSSFASELTNNNSAKFRDIVVSAGFVQPSEDGRCPRHVVTPFAVNDQWGYTPVGADGTPELYDLSDDPCAEQNIVADNPEMLAATQSKFMTHLESIHASEATKKMWSPR